MFTLSKSAFFLCALLSLSASAYAIEVAPRISDREIITALTELKMGQKEINQHFEQINQRLDRMQSASDLRFNDMQNASNARFNDVQNSISDLRETTKLRFSEIKEIIRYSSAQSNKRLGFIENLMLITITSIVGLVAFIIWDRKTALRPLEKKLDKLEQDLQHDLELKSPEGSRLTRMIHAFRELAKHDPEVAKALQSFSLL